MVPWPAAPAEPGQPPEPAAIVPPDDAAARMSPAPTASPVLAVASFAAPAGEPAGHALLAALRSDLAARWLRNHRATELREGPTEQAASFNVLPQWSALRLLETRGDWMLVYYEGDGQTRQPGPGWVRAADVGAVGAPPLWIEGTRAGGLWSAADASAKRIHELPPGTRMELDGPEPIQEMRVKVRLPGDGRGVPPARGWVDAADVSRSRTPAPEELPWAYPAVLAADVRIPTPYRTQLDGSDFARANCGPTVLGMALELFGVDIPPKTLRQQVLAAQESAWDDEEGSFIWALATVAQGYGLKTFGLYEPDWSTFRRWSIDDVRAEVRRGHPVILQVWFRGLPRRADSDYEGDHYIVVTGLVGESFLYNDPIGGTPEHEGPGYDRVMSASELRRAMNASDYPYAYTGFALSR